MTVEDKSIEANDKIKASDLPGVCNTALMTIYCRAMDYKSGDSILNDKNAFDITQRIDCHWKAIKKGLYGHDFRLTSLRARMFDQICQEFLKRNPDGIVVSLGCGLDTRFERLDNGKYLLVDLDLPEIISLKKKLFNKPGASSDRNLLLGQSVLDYSWVEAVYKLSKSGQRKVFFVAEGLIPYLDKNEIKELFGKIHDQFKGSEIVFDVIGAKGLKFMAKHSGIKEWNATLKSGFNTGREIEVLCPGFKLIEEWTYPDDPDARKGLMLKLMWKIPLFRYLLFFIHGRF